MGQKTKNKKITTWLILFSFALVVGVMFLMMDDFSEGQTSLVKKYWGGSSQCVAYVQKYYKDAFGVDLQNIGMAQSLYGKAPQYGLYAHRNGGITPPQPGDILVFGHRNRVGHVAVVTGVIEEGVLIVEQNWQGSGITTNGGKPLPMVVSDGTYTMLNRKDFNVIGWVSRMAEAPGNFFDFLGNSTSGWIVENNTKTDFSQTGDFWRISISGKNPSLVSPIFNEGIGLGEGGKIAFRARILGNSSVGEGRIFFRDQEGLWRQQVSFSLDGAEDFQEAEVDLSSLGKDTKITQMKLVLNSSALPFREQWDLDWLLVSTFRQQERFPVE